MSPYPWVRKKIKRRKLPILCAVCGHSPKTKRIGVKMQQSHPIGPWYQLGTQLMHRHLELSRDKALLFHKQYNLESCVLCCYLKAPKFWWP